MDAPVPTVMAAWVLLPDVMLLKARLPENVPVIVPLQDRLPVELYIVHPVEP